MVSIVHGELERAEMGGKRPISASLVKTRSKIWAISSSPATTKKFEFGEIRQVLIAACPGGLIEAINDQSFRSQTWEEKNKFLVFFPLETKIFHSVICKKIIWLQDIELIAFLAKMKKSTKFSEYFRFINFVKPNPFPTRKSSEHVVEVVKWHIRKGKSTLTWLD